MKFPTLTAFTRLAMFMPLDEYEHAYTVAGICKDDERTCVVALLHDIVEDGYATFEELQQRFDLDNEQMAALDAVTRRQGERYFDYIERCKQNEMANTAKLADLQDNIRRCAEDLPNRWGLIRRYAKAYGILIGAWNTRPATDAKDREIKWLKTALKQIAEIATRRGHFTVATWQKDAWYELAKIAKEALANAPDMNVEKMEG